MLSVSVASHLVDASVEGVAQVLLPAGWRASTTERPYRLTPSGYERFSVKVTPAADAEPGVHFVALRTAYGGQQVEDVVTVAIDGQADFNEDLAVTAHLADSACVEVLLQNRTRGEIHGELQLIAPHDLWDAIPAPTRGFSVAAGAEARVVYELSIPAGARPGTYWAVAKAMYYGRARYTETLPLVIEG